MTFKKTSNLRVSQNAAPITVVMHLIYYILFLHRNKNYKIKAFGMSLLHCITTLPITMPYSQEKQRGG
jgi:hypothetical protein